MNLCQYATAKMPSCQKVGYYYVKTGQAIFERVILEASILAERFFQQQVYWQIDALAILTFLFESGNVC